MFWEPWQPRWRRERHCTPLPRRRRLRKDLHHYRCLPPANSLAVRWVRPDKSEGRSPSLPVGGARWPEPRRAATEVRMIFKVRTFRQLTSCSRGSGGVLHHLPAAYGPPAAKFDGAIGTRNVGSLLDGIIGVLLGGARCSDGTVPATCARGVTGVQVICARHAVKQRRPRPRA